MRRPALLLLILLLALAAPVYAQDDFTPEEQTALDEIRAALDQFMSAETYTLAVEQKMDQNLIMAYLGQNLTLDQSIGSAGTLEFARIPENEYADRHLILTQTIESDLQGAGNNQQQSVGPIQTQMVVVDDRIYIKMDVPAELQAAIPAGWHDVTDGAESFPGLALFDLQGLLKIGETFGPDYLINLFGAVTSVEIQEPETVEGRDVNYYRLVLDPALALQGIGAGNLEGMFNAEQSPFDIAGFIELMYSDEDTAYTVIFAIYADDQTLYRYVEEMHTDILIPASLITDPSIQGAEMTLVQDVIQTLQPQDVNMPVSIEAPNLNGS